MRVLDATCGSKMMWFEKNHPDVVYADIRRETHILCDGRILEISPDIEMDFRDMPFKDGTFSLVVFDPPHLRKLGRNAYMAKKYGVLEYHWRDDIRDGLKECMRVLKKDGVLIFKWNQSEIRIHQILDLLPAKPLFGHTSGKGGLTIWMTFMKGDAA